MQKRLLFFFILVLAMVPLSAAMAQGDANTLIRILPDDADATFNPMLTQSVNSSLVTEYMWPTLTRPDPESGLRVPYLATWDVSEDGLTYTFHIREDANWSDGTPITAQDVKFTYEAPASDLVTSPRASNVARVSEINVIDEKTVEFVMSEVYCTVLYDLAYGILPSAKYAPDFSDFMDGDFNFNPDISGGPYVLQEREADTFMRFTANPEYFLGKPKIENLIWQVIVDPQIIAETMLLGAADWAERVTPEDAERYAQSDNMTLYNFASNRLITTWFNHADPTNPQPAYDADGNPIDQGTNPFFSDIRVRKAIVMGWNHDDAVFLLGEGPRRIPGPVTSAISWALAPDVEPYPYDPEGAAALLDEAGWTDGDGDGVRECNGCMYAEAGTPLEFSMAYATGILEADRMVIIMQDQLGQIGIKLNLQSSDLGAFVSTLTSQEFDMGMIGFSGGTPDPSELTRSLLYSHNDVVGGGGFNTGSYINPDLDVLIDQAEAVPGCAAEDRAPLYYEIQKIAHEDVAYDWISDRVSITALNNRIKNVVFGPWAFNDISEWTLE